MTSGEGERPPVPPPPVVMPMGAIDYQRPSTARAGQRQLPYAVGYVTGFAVFAACCGTAWAVGRLSPFSSCVLVLLVPIGSLVIAGVLQMTLEWRGVVAGALTAMCLSLLTCGIGVAAICGWR